MSKMRQLWSDQQFLAAIPAPGSNGTGSTLNGNGTGSEGDAAEAADTKAETTEKGGEAVDLQAQIKNRLAALVGPYKEAVANDVAHAQDLKEQFGIVKTSLANQEFAEAAETLDSLEQLLGRQTKPPTPGEPLLPSNTMNAAPASGGKAAPANAPIGELVNTDPKDIVITVQKPLGVITFGRHRATVWAMTDSAGAIVRSGRGPQADLATMNEFGDAVVRAVAQLNELEGQGRQSVEVVRKAAAQRAIDIKKVEGQLPAMRERRRKASDFFRNVNDYLTDMEKAEGIVCRIRKAEEELKIAASTLQKKELWGQANEKKKEVKEAEDKVKGKEAEIAQAKAMVGAILDVAQKVIKQDWTGLASKALEFARDKAIDALMDAKFGKDLSDLRAQPDKAKSDLEKLTDQTLAKAIEAARDGVSAALIELDNAKSDFHKALGQLCRLQTIVSDTLKKSNSTAQTGVMLAQGRAIARH